MRMYVIGITSDGTLEGSEFTIKILGAIADPLVGAFLVEDPDDSLLLRSRFQCELTKFLLINDRGLAELQRRDLDIKALGEANSAEFRRRRILSPIAE